MYKLTANGMNGARERKRTKPLWRRACVRTFLFIRSMCVCALVYIQFLSFPHLTNVWMCASVSRVNGKKRWTVTAPSLYEFDTIHTWKRWKIHTYAFWHATQIKFVCLLFFYVTRHFYPCAAIFPTTNSSSMSAVAVVLLQRRHFFGLCALLIRIISFVSHFLTMTQNLVDGCMHISFFNWCFFTVFASGTASINRLLI